MKRYSKPLSGPVSRGLKNVSRTNKYLLFMYSKSFPRRLNIAGPPWAIFGWGLTCPAIWHQIRCCFWCFNQVCTNKSKVTVQWMLSQILMLNVLKTDWLYYLQAIFPSHLVLGYSVRNKRTYANQSANRYHTPAISIKITCGKISSLVISIFDIKMMVPLFCLFQILRDTSEVSFVYKIWS